MSAFKKRFGLESIDFQSGVFHTDLTIAVEKLRSSKKYETDNIKKAGLSEVIKHHTNLSVDVNVKDNVFGACVEVPQVDKNHPLINDELKSFRWRDASTAINTLGRPLTGTVNRKTSKVDGDFANMRCDVYLDPRLLNDKDMSNGEIAAIILHEVGHLFTYFEYLGYSYKTNIVLAGVVKAFYDTQDVKERKMILRLAEKNLGVKYDDIDALADSRADGVLETVTITDMARRMRSELGENLYDCRQFEQLADEFAARHGAGRDNATALGKLYRKFGDTSSIGAPMYLAMEIMKLTFFTLALALLPPLAILAAIISFPAGEVYDTPEVRIGKLKNQIVMRLKSDKLPDKLRAQLLEDIEAIKAVENQLDDKRGFYRIFVETVFPTRRKMKQQMEIQIELEQLASNEIFVAASKYNVGAANA
jgi:hypothetical protein